MDWSWVTQFLNAEKVAGYTRGVVSAEFGLAIAKWPVIAQYVDGPTQAAIGAAVAGVAVGVWSHIAKKIADQTQPRTTIGMRAGAGIGSAILLAFVLFGGDARAADQLPAKAPPLTVVTGYPYNAAGFYWGLGASSMADSVSTANTGVVALGAGFDLAFGYQTKGGLAFISYDFTATFQNIGASGLCGTNGTPCASTSKIELEPGIKFGFPWQTFQNALPNFQSLFPGLPTLNITQAPNSVPHPYMYVGIPIRDLSASYGPAISKSVWVAQAAAGIGVQNEVAANAVADCRAEALLSGAGVGITGAAPKSLFGFGAQSRCHILF